MRRTLILLILLVLAEPVLAAPVSAEPVAGPDRVAVLGDGPDQLNVGIGLFNVANGGDTPAAARVEWRSGRKFLRLGPLIGILGDRDGGVFTYAGLHLDIGWRQFVLTPQSSVGAWCEGDSKDLGGTLQFRSALELGWRLSGGSRVGVQVGHMSNADLHRHNPGENDLFLTFTWPF